MKAWATVPANSTAIAFGLGLSMIPKVTASTIDGFVVGVLLSGVCCLLFLASRRDWLSRTRPRSADDLPPIVACEVTMPDIFMAAPVLSTSGIEAAERLELPESVFFGERGPDPDCPAARSRHGLDQRAPITWRSVLTPTYPRHAAPSPVLSAFATGIGVVATKFAVRPLPVRN